MKEKIKHNSPANGAGQKMIEERATNLAQYIIDSKDTVRGTAKKFKYIIIIQNLKYYVECGILLISTCLKGLCINIGGNKMKLKIFTSSGSPEFAVCEANRFIRNIYEKGFEAGKVGISEINDFWDGYGQYTLKVFYEAKEKPILRKIDFVAHYYYQQDALNKLEKISDNNYVDIDVFECNSFWAGKEVSGVVLF